MRRGWLATLALLLASVDAAARPCRGGACVCAAKPKKEARGRLVVPNTARHVLASATSGAIAVTLLAPVEVIRVNMVVNSGLTLRAALTSLRGAMFRGNTADVIAGSMRLGIIMPAFALYKQTAANLLARVGPADDAKLPGWAVFGAGALAGCTATCILFPLEVARTRMAMECSIDSVYSCLATVWNAEGLRAVYRGLTTSLVGVMPFNAIKLTSYEALRHKVIARREGGGGGFRADAAASIPPALTAAVGAVAGVTAATSCYPIEVIRRRQMMGELAGLGVGDALAALVRAEGAAALYRGVFVNMAKVALSNGLGFVLYEVMKDVLHVDGRLAPWEKGAGSPAAGRAGSKPARRVRAVRAVRA